MNRKIRLLAGTLTCAAIWSCVGDPLGPTTESPRGTPFRPVSFMAFPVPGAPGVTIESLEAGDVTSANEVNDQGRVLVLGGTSTGGGASSLVRWWTEGSGLVTVGSLESPIDMNESGTTVGIEPGGASVVFATPGGSGGNISHPVQGGTATSVEIDNSGAIKAAFDFFAFVEILITGGPGAGIHQPPGPLLADEVDFNSTFGGLSPESDEKNDSGQIAGTFEFEGIRHAGLFTPGQSVAVLGELPGHVRSQARAVNDLGDVVGWSQDASGKRTAVIWKNATTIPAPIGLGTLPGHAESEAEEINNLGFVVGRSIDSLGVQTAVLWRVPQDAITVSMSTDRQAFTPVLARGFNAVSQVALHDGAAVTRTDLAVGTLELLAGTIPVVNMDISLRVAPEDSSGFHFHDAGSRPVGRFLTPSGLDSLLTVTTDANGMATFTYQTSGLSGREDLVAEFDDGTTMVSDTVPLFIGVPLVEMDRVGTDYTYVVDNLARHAETSDNFVDPQAEGLLTQIFADYIAEVGPSGFIPDGRSDPNTFVITEASLPNGGLFDVGPEVSGIPPWQNPHQFHRVGLDFDIRRTNIAPNEGTVLKRICKKHNTRCVLETNHWHFYVDNDNRQSVGFING